MRESQASRGPGGASVALKLAGVAGQPGYASLLATITFLSGVQLTVIGMAGHYVARIYDEARARPLYLVREARRFAAGSHAAAEAAGNGASGNGAVVLRAAAGNGAVVLRAAGGQGSLTGSRRLPPPS